MGPALGLSHPGPPSITYSHPGPSRARHSCHYATVSTIALGASGPPVRDGWPPSLRMYASSVACNPAGITMLIPHLHSKGPFYQMSGNGAKAVTALRARGRCEPQEMPVPRPGPQKCRELPWGGAMSGRTQTPMLTAASSHSHSPGALHRGQDQRPERRGRAPGRVPTMGQKPGPCSSTPFS